MFCWEIVHCANCNMFCSKTKDFNFFVFFKKNKNYYVSSKTTEAAV